MKEGGSEFSRQDKTREGATVGAVGLEVGKVGNGQAPYIPVQRRVFREDRSKGLICPDVEVAGGVER